MSERLTPSQLARKLGVSRQAIYNLQERGILPRETDGKLDVDHATHIIAQSVHPASKTSGAVASTTSAPPADNTKPPAIDYHVAKTLREYAEAKIAQVKLDEMLKKLVPIADLEIALRSAHLAAREWLRGEARPLAEECADLSVDDIERILQRAFDTLLIRLAHWQGETENDDDELDEEDE